MKYMKQLKWENYTAYNLLQNRYDKHETTTSTQLQAPDLV